MPTWIRQLTTAFFWILSPFSVRLAARAALRLFTTPVGARKPKISGRRLEKALSVLDEAERRDADGLAIWVWNDAPGAETVVLVHGWTSMALYMTAFVEPLVEAGFRVVAFDFPGHGETPGRHLPFDRAGDIVVQVANRHQPVRALLGHSFGSSMVVLAASGAPPVRERAVTQSLILISSANELSGVTQRFADSFGLRPEVKDLLDRRLEELGGQPIAFWSAVRGLERAAVPALLVHDRSDSVVPFAEAEEIVRNVPSARLFATDRLGHNRVLYAEPVVEAVAQFLAEG